MLSEVGITKLVVCLDLCLNEANQLLILAQARFFHEDLTMKTFLQPFLLLPLQEEHLSVDGKRCALGTG